MTHTRPLADHEGDFQPWQKCLANVCFDRACRSAAVEFREWESHDGAYVDVQYRCLICGKTWWVDGIDS